MGKDTGWKILEWADGIAVSAVVIAAAIAVIAILKWAGG